MLVLLSQSVKGGIFEHESERYRGPVTTSAIRAVAALEDELRRGLYAYIRAARHPVTREEAAASAGISRKLAAFHLDKMVDAGLLRASYQSVYQSTGTRKVGRTPKVYEPAGDDPAHGVAWGQLVLAALSLATLAVSGSLGGMLAYHFGVRVADEATQAEGYREED